MTYRQEAVTVMVSDDEAKLGHLAAHIAAELANDRPVYDGVRWVTFDDVQEAVDRSPECARLARMLMLASTAQQKERAAAAYQLLFRRTAKRIADDLALVFYLQLHRQKAANNAQH